MFGIENLKTYTSCELYYKASDEFKVGEAYLKDEADKVMDAMERRIKRLTALVEGWKRNSVELGKAYHKRLAMEQERNKELEESQVKVLALGVSGGLRLRIKELETTISKMETTESKWISVKDRLPNEEEQYKLLWVGYVRNGNTIKYMYEASFDYKTKQFYTENDWGDKTFIEPEIWMVVPQPPTTKEK